MYKGIDNQNQKALTERRRIILNNHRLNLQIPHITLLDITFNRTHKYFNYIVNHDKLPNAISSAFNKYLNGVKITHERNKYDIMGPFFGKNFNFSGDHIEIKDFRNSIYGFLGNLIGKLYYKDKKNLNGINYYYYGLPGDSLENSLYCIPEYHTSNKWIGHISVVRMRDVTWKDKPLNRLHQPIIISGIDPTKNLNYYIVNKESDKVKEIINKYISDNIRIPIKYINSRGIIVDEKNINGDMRRGIMPWKDITFNSGQSHIHISLTNGFNKYVN